MDYKPLNEINANDFSLDVFTSNEPLVIRGIVNDWPIVKKSSEEIQKISEYLLCYYENDRIIAFASKSELGNKFTYGPNANQMSFEQLESTLDLVLETINESSKLDNPGTVYMGSTTLDYVLPGFDKDNNFSIGDASPLKSIWVGNQTIVPPHYDVPDNIAFVCAGTRKFTLFPPSQLKNMYVGPLEHTPAGQPISLVDIDDPDLTKFPKFEEAMGHGLSAVLGPGDGIFIPSLWWHQVESFGKLNILVNYWWRDVPSFMGNPMDALMHSILSIRDLPEHQKENWANMFQHYVFNNLDENFNHIPDNLNGSHKKINDELAKNLRALLLKNLNR